MGFLRSLAILAASFPILVHGESFDIGLNITALLQQQGIRIPTQTATTLRGGENAKGRKLLMGTASSSGDAHFKTFGGQKFDFPGACDLVLLDSPKFAEGLGLSIHIRTKTTGLWTSISSAVIQIGDQSLEVHGCCGPKGVPHYWVSGEEGSGDVDNDMRLAYLFDVLNTHFPHFYAHYKRLNAKQHEFHLEFNKRETIQFKVFKDWLTVVVKIDPEAGTFRDVRGMMGSFQYGGHMVARDGVTLLVQDPVAFGQEWQVRPDEDPVLFHDAQRHERTKCDLPQNTAERQERNILEYMQQLHDFPKTRSKSKGTATE